MARLLVAGLLLVATTPLLAQPTPAPMAPRGVAETTTRAEIQARVETRFIKRDANRDGFLTSEEMTKGAGGMRVRRSEGQQAMRDPNVAFDRLDSNRDGSISRDEFARNRVVQIERRRVVSQSGEPGGAQWNRGRGMRGGAMGGGMLKMADANRDGRVSLAEATAGALQRFDMMDANRDGRITPEERRAGRMMMREMRMRKAG